MELLNGKAKELFKKWLDKQVDFRLNKYTKEIVYMGAIGFESLNQTMKNALIIEWFDSIGIHIEFEVIDPVDLKFNYTVFCNDSFRTDTGRFLRIGNRNYKTRQEATTEAIKKAVELINKDYEQSR